MTRIELSDEEMIELSDEEIEYSTYFPIDDPHDIMYSFEEMVRMYTQADLEIDSYILERAKEINIKNSN
jgi:hypothetical protein